MKRGRFTSAIIPALAASALAVGLAASTATAATSHPAARTTATATTAVARAATPKPVVFTCLNHAVVRPGSYMLACADGGHLLTGLSWQSWTPASATATGRDEQNDCVPDCARGKFHSYPAIVVLWRSEPVAHHPGETYYSRVTVLYPDAHPLIWQNGKLVPGPQTWTQGLLG